MRAVIGRKHLHELFENHILPRIRVSRFNGADIPVQNHAELIDHTLEDGVEDFVVVVAFAGAQFPFYDLIITGGQVAVVLVQVKNGIASGVHQHRPDVSAGSDRSQKLPVTDPQVADVRLAGIGIRIFEGHIRREDEDIAGADVESIPSDREGEGPGLADADQDQAAAFFRGGLVHRTGLLERAGNEDFCLHGAKIRLFSNIMGNFD